MEQVLSLLWVSKDLRNHQLHGGKAFKFSCHKICGRYSIVNFMILKNVNNYQHSAITSSQRGYSLVTQKKKKNIITIQHHKMDQHGELTLDIFHVM